MPCAAVYDDCPECRGVFPVPGYDDRSEGDCVLGAYLGAVQDNIHVEIDLACVLDHFSTFEADHIKVADILVFTVACSKCVRRAESTGQRQYCT